MSKTVTGARAKIFVDNVLVGIFDSCSISDSTGTEGIFILGRYTASEIAVTSKELVNINCSGFRLVKNGKHVLPKVPKVQDLLNLAGFTMSVVDRQTNETIETILDCVWTSSSVNYSAKATSKLTLTAQGIISSDEAGPESESANAANLP